MPQRFKYLTPDTGRIVLTNRTLRWSTPPELNDPFDMQFAFQIRIDRDAARAMALEKAWQHHNGELLDRPLNKLGRVIRALRERGLRLPREKFDQEFGEAITASLDGMETSMVTFTEVVRQHFENDKILCLSDVPDSVLMWSYYAQNHAGLVLCFTNETPDNPFSEARQVRYVEQIPSLFDDETLSDMMAGYGGLDHKRIMGEVVWTKSNYWAHEREWRIYTGPGRTGGAFEDVPFGAEELVGVILGARATEAYRQEVRTLMAKHYPHATVSQARVRADTYALTIEPLT